MDFALSLVLVYSDLFVVVKLGKMVEIPSFYKICKSKNQFLECLAFEALMPGGFKTLAKYNRL